MLMVAPAVRAGVPERPWREIAAPARVVFARPEAEPYSLVDVPARIDSVQVTSAAAWCGGDVHPVRLVCTNADTLTCLVDCQGLGVRQDIALYLLTNAAPPAAAEPLADPNPVRFCAQRTAGQDLPESLPQVDLLDARVDREPAVSRVDGFDVDEDSPSGWYHGDWQRRNHLVDLSSWLRFPAAGRHIFSLRADQPMWLLVDGACVLQSHAGRGGWEASPPVSLTPGLHRVLVRGVCRQRMRLALTWAAEWRTDDPGVELVTGGDKRRGRLELRNRRLHALATAAAGVPYRFDGIQDVFVPFRLEDASVSWDERPLTCAWRLDGAMLGTGHALRTVLRATAAQQALELQVSDDRGATACDSISLNLAGPARRDYRVCGRLVGVPPFGYGEDVVRPEIHIRSSDEDASFEVEADLASPNGRVQTCTGRVDLVRSWGRLALPACSADALARISWRVRHAGVVVDSDTTIFAHAPFGFQPDAVDGETLRCGTHGLVLVAPHASAGETRPFDGLKDGQRLLVLDGFLSAAAGGTTNLAALDRRLRGSSGGAVAACERIDLRESGTSSPGGVSALASLLRVEGLPPADVVVLAPSFDELAEGETPAQFERRLSTLVGLIAARLSATVILVTPPPFERLPGWTAEALALAGNRPPAARTLAETICRVADANGMPVADLYTGFMTGERQEPRLREGILTDTGVRQAADIIGRAVYGASKEAP